MNVKIGFIDYFLDEWHANNYPAWISEASNGRMEVAYAYAKIDSPKPDGMTTNEWCHKYGVARCETIEELVEKSDCIIVLSPDDPEHHESLAEIPLRSGKRTYIDKTFAPDKLSAVRMLSLADRHKTPCYSSSALRFATEYTGFGENRGGKAVEAISSWGPGYYGNYSVHQLEPLIMLMGGVPEAVCYSGTGSFTQLTIRFEDGRIAVMHQFVNGSPFMMQICTANENKIVEVKSDFFKDFMKELVDFFDTGDVKVDPVETIRIMAVREAGLKAQLKPGKWIKV